MTFKHLEKVSIALLSLVLLAAAVSAQAPLPRPRPHIVPATNITVDGNEAMFTTMCALYASGFESGVSTDNWSAFRAQMRDRLRQQKGPAVDAVRQFYQKHESRDTAEMLSRYVWFGIVSGPAPKFLPVLRPTCLLFKSTEQLSPTTTPSRTSASSGARSSPFTTRKSSASTTPSRKSSSSPLPICANLTIPARCARFPSSSSRLWAASQTSAISATTTRSF
jgi:hypothetical protein